MLQGTQREAQQCKYSVRLQAAAPTNQGGKWLHNQAGPQDNQQICLLKVFEALKKALRKVFAKEDNVWFYKATCKSASVSGTKECPGKAVILAVSHVW